MNAKKTITFTRHRIIGFDVDWLVNTETKGVEMVVKSGDKLDIAPYGKEFVLSFDENNKCIEAMDGDK